MNDKSTLQTLAAIATILALVVAVIALFVHNDNPAPVSSNAANGTVSTPAIQPTSAAQSTSASPGNINTPASTSASTATPVQRSIAPGTELCAASSSQGWNGWVLGSSWHDESGTLVNDGTDSAGTFSPNLLPPDSCQGQVADVAIKAQIKLDALGYGGFGLDVRGQNTPNGWGGYAFQMYIACYDSSNSSCVTPNLEEVDFDPESNQLGTGQYGVGSAFHTYEFDIHGNAITVKIDGATILSATDNRYLSPGQVGLFCKNNTQIEVRSVRIVAL